MAAILSGSGRRVMGAAVILLAVVLSCVVSGSFASQDMKVKAAPSANATAGARYRSNLELEAALKNFTQRCSHISRLYTIGSSTLGVPLWALEISDKPGVSEPEAAFKPALISIAFFVTGNMASAASFEIFSVYGLITSCDPFIMGALLMCRVFVLFILVAGRI